MDLETRLIIYVHQGLIILLLISALIFVFKINKDAAELENACKQPNLTTIHFLSLCAKPLTYYLVYFNSAIFILVILLGRIQHGPNIPYLVFLVVVGIPYIMSFIQFYTLAARYRYRLLLAGQSLDQTSSLVSGLLFSVPIIYFALIWIILSVANLLYG
jgi:hypothetical protein